MSKVIAILVSDNSEHIERLKKQLVDQGTEVQSFGPKEWREGLENSDFRHSVLGSGVAALAAGSQPLRPQTLGYSNVVQFPTPATSSISIPKVAKMEEMEMEAIQNAIRQFNGNLTEAAKALGIGRATLYRRVKYFKIDPNLSRRRRVA